MKPRMLDLFSRAGGAAVGYARAGFEVTGIDHEPQKRYPFTFHLADALEYVRAHGHEFDAIHASPPCQPFTALRALVKRDHPDLLEPTRAALIATGKPWIIENVVGAPLQWYVMLCGSMFGLQTKCGAQLRRHRIFESNVLLMAPGPCRHGATTVSVQGHQPYNEQARMRQRRETIGVFGTKPTNQRIYRAAQRGLRVITVTGSTPHHELGTNRTPRADGSQRPIERATFSVDDAREAMGIDWMPMSDLSQAIPPAYTQFLGRQLIAYLERTQ